MGKLKKLAWPASAGAEGKIGNFRSCVLRYVKWQPTGRWHDAITKRQTAKQQQGTNMSNVIAMPARAMRAKREESGR